MVSKNLLECFFCISLYCHINRYKILSTQNINKLHYRLTSVAWIVQYIISMIVHCPYIPHSENWLLWTPAWECHSFFFICIDLMSNTTSICIWIQLRLFCTQITGLIIVIVFFISLSASTVIFAIRNFLNHEDLINRQLLQLVCVCVCVCGCVCVYVCVYVCVCTY